ncbi:hypothetical protein [Shewanella atlantica]|uniref:DUF3019 domain-containing protein n=1 Tax=Shewanella atlantica TaxID=271099 RepID=A0A431W752_9GAMM|nr:hypothetical protein [Shewanella atlantica]RTR31276.1 hypothetical protein EKG39_14540 [Shewanella atlantica]
MIKKLMNRSIILASSLIFSISPAFASTQTAVTAQLIKSEAEGSVLICQYRTIKQVHFKVLFTNQTCPLEIQVDH